MVKIFLDDERIPNDAYWVDIGTFEVQILPKFSEFKVDPIIVNIGKSGLFIYPDCINFHTVPDEYDLLWDSLKENDKVSFTSINIISGIFNKEEIIKIMESSAFKSEIDEAVSWLNDPHLFKGFSSGEFYLRIAEDIDLENQFELKLSRFLSH